MSRPKNKYIPYSLFHTLWDIAGKESKETEYTRRILSPESKDRILFMKKYGIREDKALDLLKSVYGYRWISVKEILRKAGKRKADVSHELCIPIRTIEDWYNEKATCPAYTKLMILKEYSLFKLPNGIALGKAPEEQKKPQKEKESDTLPLITQRERSVKHRTYVEEMRAMEEYRKERQKANSHLDRYIRKHSRQG